MKALSVAATRACVDLVARRRRRRSSGSRPAVRRTPPGPPEKKFVPPPIVAETLAGGRSFSAAGYTQAVSAPAVFQPDGAHDGVGRSRRAVLRTWVLDEVARRDHPLAGGDRRREHKRATAATAVTALQLMRVSFDGDRRARRPIGRSARSRDLRCGRPPGPLRRTGRRGRACTSRPRARSTSGDDRRVSRPCARASRCTRSSRPLEVSRGTYVSTMKLGMHRSYGAAMRPETEVSLLFRVAVRTALRGRCATGRRASGRPASGSPRPSSR